LAAGYLRTLLPHLLVTLVWFAALFAGAGTLHWGRGLIYLVASLIAIISIDAFVRRRNPVVLEERAKLRGKNTEGFDKALLGILFLTHFAQAVIAGLDAVRFRWSSVPFGAVYAGLLFFTLSSVLVAWTLSINPHAESTVRIQTERDHKVISAGPYKFVRHPMYFGIVLGYIGGPLILGSLWALGLSGVMIAIFAVRTALEDQALRRDLPGYEEYTKRTRYRLIPGAW